MGTSRPGSPAWRQLLRYLRSRLRPDQTAGGARLLRERAALMARATAARVLKIGMIGIGVGGAEILPAMEAMESVELVAGADVVPETLARFSQRFSEAKTYNSAEALCRDPDVEAVWISSPNRFHAEHAILA